MRRRRPLPAPVRSADEDAREAALLTRANRVSRPMMDFLDRLPREYRLAVHEHGLGVLRQLGVIP